MNIMTPSGGFVPLLQKLQMLAHEDLLTAVRAPARIHYNGTVVASHPAVHTVSCEINIKQFPLDDQRCAIEVVSWAYGQEKIRLHAMTDHSLEHYKKNEEWHLLSINVSEARYDHEGISVSEVKFEVSLKRRPLFYMVTLTFPSYVMCAISVVGLFARFSTTGEREYELDEMELQESSMEILKRKTTNGYVLISERLDVIFMTFFLSAVTIPVVVLFYLSQPSAPIVMQQKKRNFPTGLETF
ncbi:unnamed protein product [Caenorhabditis auriculariae]|uniref:Neurotransmitter-gated ion-channel ligand-binding domain-containing protein n=1 Tax=Caenorhabditis auriculariae TaxID=2777116 RepID=A0A8S1H9D3_9PELO|nr:unnamed protein product [Caenorhabditis auriculariae]